MARKQRRSTAPTRQPAWSTRRSRASNSFTEGEAKSRIETLGFANVSNLKKDDTGVWRGHAMKNGQPVDISLDYQGNVVEGGAGRAPPCR